MWEEGEIKLILTSQKVEVWNLVSESGLDHSEFVWSTARSDHRPDLSVSILRYSGSRYFFQFDFNWSDHTCKFSPAGEQAVDYAESGDWGNQLIHVGQWLEYLKREVTTEDPWVRLAKAGLPQGSGLTEDNEDSGFTEHELQGIRSALLDFRSYVEEQFDLGAEQRSFITEQTEYLIEASKRQSRRDWRNTCLGVVALIVSALGMISPEQAIAVWHFLSARANFVLQLRLPR